MEIISRNLNEIMNEPKTIYVLKGFNTIYKELEIKLDHIFDLSINEDLMNIFNVNDRMLQRQLFDQLENDKSFFCFYEELLYIEKKNYLGLIPEEYNIQIIDIGCFEYQMPGFIQESYEKVIKKFEEEKDDLNILQRIYNEYKLRNLNPIVIYNNLENIGRCKIKKLFNSYDLNYMNFNKNAKNTYNLTSTANDEILIEVFNKILNNECDSIEYVVSEKKENSNIKKFLYLVNYFWKINVYEKEDKKENKSIDLEEEYLNILKRNPKITSFRNIPMYENPFESNKLIEIKQSVIMDAIYKNIIKAQNKESFHDIFVTAPTGQGKSVLFQVPAIMSAEKNNLVTIVVSPLIALMKDQVGGLKKYTDCAETINSEYTPFEKEEIKDRIKEGKTSILYVSPETLLSNYDIKEIIGDRKIGLLVVDEAHTVSTWGKNFRPDYWYLGEYIQRLRTKFEYSFPIATFTATATISNGMDDMYHDIIESLNMNSCETFFGTIRRTNIEFDINVHKKISSHEREKNELVIKRLNDYIAKDEKTLVYFPYKSQLNNISEYLPKDCIGKYHADLDKSERSSNLEEIRLGQKKLILATKAFGMGVDISDITNVYHYAPTGNLADYIQEIGRAARDENLKGIATTDYFKEDYKYISQLLGLSQITTNNVVGVLRKIIEKYYKTGKRKFCRKKENFPFSVNPARCGTN